MTKRYVKDHSGIEAETIDQLEEMLSHTGQARNGETQKIVLSTIIHTSLPKRVIGMDYNWQGVDGGMNKVIPASIRKAREICDRISEVKPVSRYRKKMLVSGAIRAASTRIAYREPEQADESDYLPMTRRMSLCEI